MRQFLGVPTLWEAFRIMLCVHNSTSHFFFFLAFYCGNVAYYTVSLKALMSLMQFHLQSSISCIVKVR